MPHPAGPPVIVTLPATIDVTNVDRVHDQLAAAVATGAPLIIADLSATVSCDTAGANWLYIIGYRGVAQGGGLRLVIPPGAPLRRMLELLGVDHLLPVYSSVVEARQPSVGARDPFAHTSHPQS